MAIIAVAGRKGGVGKSTVIGNLAAEFVAMGRTVKVFDADPQHSLVAWAAQGDGMLAGCVHKMADSADTLRSQARKAEKEVDIVLMIRRRARPRSATRQRLRRICCCCRAVPASPIDV
jgi:cellulose biosynthesis protein BcsQ